MRRLLALSLFALSAAAVQAQPQTVVRDVEAESVFEQALSAYQAGDMGMAYRRFRVVYRDSPLNEKTTAALAMAAKALYRQGARSDASDLARDFVRNFPRSRYAPEMQALISRVEGQAGPLVRATVDLGVALPLTPETVALTQPFFSGLKLAVDEANAEGQVGPRLRMVYRNTRNTATGAAAAVEALRGTAAIVGPLFSDEAIGAGDAAARTGTVLIAPLATDGRVSEGHTTVFQANIPLANRGQVLGRYATETMGLRRFGIVYEGETGGTSHRLAQAFADEVQQRGGTVAVMTSLAGGWSSLTSRLGEALAGLDGLYLPVSGGNTEVDIRAALSALDRSGARLTVFGDAEWHNRAAARALGPAFRVTYTNDFSFDTAEPDVRRFVEAYRAATGQNLVTASFTTQRLAATGYSLGRYLATRVASTDLARVMKAPGAFDGVGVRFDFNGGQVNRALFIQQYTPEGLRRLQ